MNALIPNLEQTMSSREIAELTGSSHDNVLKTVRALVEKGVVFGNETPYVHPQNKQTYFEFHLNYRDTMVVVSGYSVELRAKIIDRWQELEAKVDQPAINLNDPAFLRTALLQYTEKVIELQQTITEQAPAVEFAHAVRNTEDSISIGDMARLLGTGQNRLFRRLRDDHILMSNNRPYQQYLDREYFRVIENVWRDSEGETHPTFKTVVTGRGQVYLQRKYGAEAA
ncbi:phage antirepressor KilAC domain-containing protein [Paraburkholderia elongata]|uniref:DNA-binding protein n=1 Tax=Paraburkholderia elongata TaxID=2675747 RepID=A0A972NU76_9BURK|nr:phage regulatory protein/antirepressor Ant [Paraburkholderia elongata]NPT59062.1 DNA-binding protein [Paraburkholderia elongata]